ncbi:hypothetical protein [Microbispora sp. CSR-4]|uniref:hypothetical protein n=1 Tax=Microbispora sp. CSR-4 TaxID=2592813 RepID=UPI0011CC8CB3|nr:hypothetical protein [Microbispora sp. CSR-4]
MGKGLTELTRLGLLFATQDEFAPVEPVLGFTPGPVALKGASATVKGRRYGTRAAPVTSVGPSEVGGAFVAGYLGAIPDDLYPVWAANETSVGPSEVGGAFVAGYLNAILDGLQRDLFGPTGRALPVFGGTDAGPPQARHLGSHLQWPPSRSSARDSWHGLPSHSIWLARPAAANYPVTWAIPSICDPKRFLVDLAQAPEGGEN